MRINLKAAAFALASGVLLCLSFPGFNGSGFAWFALVPMLWAAADSESGGAAFGWGWLAGTSAFCGIFCWILPTFQAAGVSSLIGLGAIALLSAYVGLYYGALAAASRMFFLRYPEPAALLLSVCAGVSLEWARNFLFSGFPWGALGYSQWQNPSVLQAARFTGVYGVSALVLLVNLALYRAVRFRKIRTASLLILAASVLSAAAAQRTRWTPDSSATPFKIAVLQGNIDQYKKWSPESVDEILQAYSGLAREAAQDPRTEVILWPESALPGWIPQETPLLRWTQSLVQATGKSHLIGAVTQDGDDSRNAAFLFGPDGGILGRYDKIHLVPFGEFVPFESWFKGWIPTLNELGGFSPGPKNRILPAPGAALGVSICYEAIFPEIARAQVRAGAEVLVNLTNDGWYLDTAAPEQHFSMGVLRAVENGRWFIRAANTGISGAVRPDGSIAERTRLNEKTWFAAEVGRETGSTFYARRGDLFAGACAASALAALLLPFIIRRRPK
jgi:apolipoprotein N-acyltransferase